MRTRVETFLAWFTLVWAATFGIAENWVAIRRGFPLVLFLDEWIAVALLVFAAARSLRTPTGSPGLLSTGWAFAFCLMLQAWQSRTAQERLDPWNQQVLSILRWSLPLIGLVFLASLYLASRRPGGAQPTA